MNVSTVDSCPICLNPADKGIVFPYHTVTKTWKHPIHEACRRIFEQHSLTQNQNLICSLCREVVSLAPSTNWGLMDEKPIDVHEMRRLAIIGNVEGLGKLIVDADGQLLEGHFLQAITQAVDSSGYVGFGGVYHFSENLVKTLRFLRFMGRIGGPI